MKLKLYEIQQEYISLAEKLIENSGELTPELEQSLQINKEQLEQKGICYAFIVKEIESEVDIIDSEIKRLTALKVSRNKSVERIKETLSQAMQMFEIDKIKSPLVKINFIKSESVEVEESFCDKDFIQEKISFHVDKRKLKFVLKSGEIIVGAKINYNKNLQIK